MIYKYKNIIFNNYKYDDVCKIIKKNNLDFTFLTTSRYDFFYFKFL